MNDTDYQAIFALADKLFLSGLWPQAAQVSDKLQLSEDEATKGLAAWQVELPRRAVIANVQEEPSADFKNALSSLWKDAVSTAAFQYRQDLESLSNQHESSQQEILSVNQELQQQLLESQKKIDHLQNQAGHEVEERSVLLAGFENTKKQLDDKTKEAAKHQERVEQLTNDNARVQRQLDETRETFESRLKEEQHHQQDQHAKLENEIRNIRLQSQTRSDEFSKTESALNKQINDLQAELSKRELKLESIVSQSRSVESELKKLQSKQGGQQQELTQMKNQLLAESNKSKRLDEKIQKLTKELGSQQQATKQASTEAASRESKLRQENQRLMSEMNNLNHQLSVFEKKLASKEDQLKKLKRTVVS